MDLAIKNVSKIIDLSGMNMENKITERLSVNPILLNEMGTIE